MIPNIVPNMVLDIHPLSPISPTQLMVGIRLGMMLGLMLGPATYQPLWNALSTGVSEWPC